MKRYAMLVLFIAFNLSNLAAEDKTDSIQLDTPKNWTGETIKLPPPFAPKMKLKGTEVIRFAPGMFDAKSDSFFSYAFVFEVDSEPELTREIVQQELLVYYRGLSSAVLKSRGKTVDTSKFTMMLKKQDGEPSKPTRYEGNLEWVEPFSTQQTQTLRFEVVTRVRPDSNLIFVCVSPQESTAKIWTELRSLRGKFYKSIE